MNISADLDYVRKQATVVEVFDNSHVATWALKRATPDERERALTPPLLDEPTVAPDPDASPRAGRVSPALRLGRLLKVLAARLTMQREKRLSNRVPLAYVTEPAAKAL